MDSERLTNFTNSEHYPPMATIKTIDGLIIALGGTRRVADMMGLEMPAVSNWIARDFIPPGHHLTLFLEIWARGLNVDPTVFGLPDGYARLYRAILRQPGKRPVLIEAL